MFFCLLICGLGFNQFLDCPSVVCESCRARWRQAVCAVNAAEIEVRHKQRNRVNEIVHLARKTGRQACESLVKMPQ